MSATPDPPSAGEPDRSGVAERSQPDAPEGGGGERSGAGRPPARRGLGATGRTVLLAVGVVVAFFAGLAGVALLTADEDRVALDDSEAEVVEEGGLGGAQGPSELPEATLEGFAGGAPVELPGDYAGEPLLVNFWATWCPPCVEEMPELQELHEDVGDELALLGVNVSDAPSNAEPFAAELGIGYDLAVDADGDYYREVESIGMPTTLLVDPEGRIVARHTGLLTAEELRELVADELGVTP